VRGREGSLRVVTKTPVEVEVLVERGRKSQSASPLKFSRETTRCQLLRIIPSLWLLRPKRTDNNSLSASTRVWKRGTRGGISSRVQRFPSFLPLTSFLALPQTSSKLSHSLFTHISLVSSHHQYVSRFNYASFD